MASSLHPPDPGCLQIRAGAKADCAEQEQRSRSCSAQSALAPARICRHPGSGGWREGRTGDQPLDQREPAFGGVDAFSASAALRARVSQTVHARGRCRRHTRHVSIVAGRRPHLHFRLCGRGRRRSGRVAAGWGDAGRHRPDPSLAFFGGSGVLQARKIEDMGLLLNLVTRPDLIGEILTWLDKYLGPVDVRP